MTEERVQEALAAHLEHIEMGGPEPDVSHLTPDELEELESLIDLLDQTQGVAFGRGRIETDDRVTATTEAGERLLTALRDAMPASSRIAEDPVATTVGIPGMAVAEGFVVGTFGGRVRVWMLAGSDALTSGDAWLRDLGGIFRLFSDTVAIALVEPDLSCLLVRPEDCAPTIEVPHGSLVSRRSRPVSTVAEVLSVFVRELIPYWEPVDDIGDPRPIDVPPIADEQASQAIDDQVAAGRRARKTNPKRTALTELDQAQARSLAKLVLDVHEGRTSVDDVEAELRRLSAK